MSESIISNKRECFVCKTPFNLHKHHIIYGLANRRISEQDGCWCYLCAAHHNMSNQGVHFNKELNLKLRRICQEKWEELHATDDTHMDFIKRFGKNYL